MSTATLNPATARTALACRIRGLGHSLRKYRTPALSYGAISILLLIPCWWQPKIAAGDLASHIYNVWLSELIRLNQAPGLWIAHQSTNMLFDTLLAWLANIVGFADAQRLAVAAGVLLFFWAAFALISVIARKRAHFVMPLLAILAYGTIFQLGLLNYYLGAAFSLAALALLWRTRFWAAFTALPLLVLAWLAQPLPPLWAVGVCAYLWMARRLAPPLQPLLLLPLAVTLLCLRHWLMVFGSMWGPKQVLHGTGLDQSYVLGHHFRLVTIPMAVLGLWLALRSLHSAGREFTFSLPAQIYGLCLLGSILLPNTLSFPWYKAQFGAVPERLGWLAAVWLCALAVQIDPPGWFRKAVAALALLYFALLYVDHRALNQIEQSVENLVAQLPPGQRVIAKLKYPLSDGLDVSMVLDRACIGKCFSFGNYEPATLQFRVRALPQNSFVAWSASEPIAQQYFSSQPSGTLYQIYQCSDRFQDLCMTSLTAPR